MGKNKQMLELEKLGHQPQWTIDIRPIPIGRNRGNGRVAATTANSPRQDSPNPHEMARRSMILPSEEEAKS